MFDVTQSTAYTCGHTCNELNVKMEDRRYVKSAMVQIRKNV